MRILDNGIAVLDGDRWISKWVEESGRLDHDQYLLQNVKRRLDRIGMFGLAVDIGAYIGDHTVAYAEWFDRVIAFEPNPDAFECLEHNAPTNVTIVNMAIGTGIGASMRVDCENPGASYFEHKGDTAPVITFPDRVDFIKIDVEGMEPDVLKVLEGTIRRDHPAMLIEQRRMDGNEETVKKFLEDHGYKYEPIPDYGEQYDIWCE